MPRVYKRNDIIKYDNYAEIITLDRYDNETNRAIIDLDNINLIKQYRWYFDKSSGYICARLTDRKIIGIHRFLLNPDKTEHIDHINRNKLDNKKSNLRICSNQENAFNTNLNSKNTSGHKGVWYDKARNKWASEIMFNYKKIFLGRFENINDAINIRNKKEIELFGDFSPLKNS